MHTAQMLVEYFRQQVSYQHTRDKIPLLHSGFLLSDSFLFSVEVLCFFISSFFTLDALCSVFVDIDRHVALIKFQGHTQWQLELTRDELPLLFLHCVVESMSLFTL